jgi:HAD superfamily hydrolase (TIGR01509 family)
MLKAIIFDCFGVLVGRGFDETYRSVGGDPYADREFIRSILGRTNMGLISPVEFRQEIVNQLHISPEEWQAAVRLAEQPDKDLLNYIETLHKKYKIAILSNANKGVVQRKLGEECVERCFDVVVISAEVGTVKPDPAIYEYTATCLGIKPAECVFIDDLNGYVQAAEKVGMCGILYHNFDQLKSDLVALQHK